MNTSNKEDFKKYIQKKRINFLQIMMFVGIAIFSLLTVDFVVRGFYTLAIINYSVAAIWLVLAIYIRKIPYLIFGHSAIFFTFISFTIISAIGFHYSTPYYTTIFLVPLLALVFLPIEHALIWIILSTLCFLSIDYWADLMSYLLKGKIIDRPIRMTLISGAIQMLLILYLAYYYRYLSVLYNRKIKEQNKKIAQVQKYKDRFIANMNHELRTPMNAIKGISELLLHENLKKEDELELKHALYKSSEHLLSIINDILDLAKIEDQKLRIEKIEFDLRATIYAAYNMLKYNATEKGLSYNLDIDASLPKYVMGDPHRLTQILVNLLSNAIKFTENGSVSLICKCKYENCSETENSDVCPLLIEVKDTGIGISENAKEIIFSPFEQGDIISQGGTGLGLTITKKLLELQNGTIHFESDSSGSQFFVELEYPITQHLSSSNDTKKSEQVQSISKNLKILLVEDNKLNQMVAIKQLSNHIHNLTIEIAENGEMAVEKWKLDVYDTILMDLQMPIMNGFEATETIRELEKESDKKRTPILALTADVSEKVMKKCTEHGFDDYIGKPFDINTLKDKIILYTTSNE